MKLKNILSCLTIIVLMTTLVFAANTKPVVTNVAFSITDTTVTVHYDVTDAEPPAVTISMEVSSDNGVTWNYNFGTASGNIGAGVVIGTNKTITWSYSGVDNNQFIIKIIADDLVRDQTYYAGKIYNTVTIGSQVWLKENLDVGTPVCYNDNNENCTTYGGLYSWAGAMGGLEIKGGQGICPTGWHIPTDLEFDTLVAAVNNDGNALLASGQGNGSGFSALLAGERRNNTFSYLGSDAFFWSSYVYTIPHEPANRQVTSMALNYDGIISFGIYRTFYEPSPWYSVRCLASWVCGEPLADVRDGKSYNTVSINGKCWMAENMNIGNMVNGTTSQTDNGVIEKYCYNDDPNYCNTYGGLYQGDEAMQYSGLPGTQGICPSGWHIPNDGEWGALTTFLGDTVNAGGRMKEEGTTHWAPPNTGASNISGFTGLPGGQRNTLGTFEDLMYQGNFWSSTYSADYFYWTRYLYFSYNYSYRVGEERETGNSVRCLIN